jgi:hypothetical protein
MPDAYTAISDVVVPEVFNPYVIERTATKSALYQSGVIVRNTALDKLAASGGNTVNMPFWQDLSGNSETIEEGTALTVNKIAASSDKARILFRAKAWGAYDLAGALAGDDPMAAIGNLVGDWWARDNQTTLLKILEGVFGAATMAANVLDISSETGTAAILDAEAYLDALAKLGDARDKITACMMHSATVTHLAKLDLIDYVPDSEGKPTVKTFLGKRIVEDDGCPYTTGGVYTSYLFGSGAIGWGEGGAPVPTETGRNQLAGQDFLINRRHFLLHPMGVAWQEDSVAGASPTNVELATESNWARVYEAKNIPIIKFSYRLTEATGS